jgi:ATP-dependent Clp protease ATP-binding subunit ClpC
MLRMQAGGYSEAARRAVTVAHSEALRLGRNCVSIELVVLGIIDADPNGLAARALTAEGIELAALRQQIAGPPDPSAHAAATDAHVPFCPETKDAVSLAVLVTEEHRQDQVDTMHILLALIRGAESRLNAAHSVRCASAPGPDTGDQPAGQLTGEDWQSRLPRCR